MSICSYKQREVSMNDDRCGSRIVHGDIVEKARLYDLPASDIERNTMLFKAMADPGRLRILHALLLQEMCVCDLAAFLDASESSVSHQLRFLRTAGLVVNRREGTVLYYRTVNERLMEVIRVATSVQENSTL